MIEIRDGTCAWSNLQQSPGYNFVYIMNDEKTIPGLESEWVWHK